jgi:protein-S-isoprenylcysteine O-methyltransferase Ste14
MKALLAYYVVFFVAAFVWPTIRLWRCERVNALVLPNDDSAYGVVGNWFRFLILAVFAALALLAAGVPVSALGSFEWLLPARPAGWVLLIASLGWIVLAQVQMGSSWRIGIDAGATTRLIQRGLFARSRNPIFLGMRVNLAGLFLALPNAVTLAFWMVGEVLMQVQVRLEEEHLSAVLGEEYGRYRQATPRWL